MTDNRYLIFTKGNNSIIVDRIGGQLVSYKINGVEILSQGALRPESSSWPATAKNLFPNPGKVGGKFQDYAYKIIEKDGFQQEVIDELGEDEALQEFKINSKNNKIVRYSLNGIPYRIAQHGFAQDMEFQVRGKQANGCIMSIETSPETLEQYPFKFRYNLGYEIDEFGRLMYDASCSNLDDKAIVAGMGWHPAFLLHDKKRTDNYVVFFKNLKKTKDCPVVEGQAYSISDIVNAGKSVVIDGIISADVLLLYEYQGGHMCQYLTMHTEEPKLVLWSKPLYNENQNPFICIEPWNTESGVLGELSVQEKTREIQGANVIEPGHTSFLSASVEVNDEYLRFMERLPSYEEDVENGK